MSPNKVSEVLGQAPKKIVILRALQLGDLLCAVPAWRALRAAFPQAEIALIGLPWAREFVRRFDRYLDTFIEFPGFPGLPERDFEPEAVTAWLADLQARRFDLALQMQGNGTFVNPLLALIGARAVAGYTQPEGYSPQPELFMNYPETGSEIHRHVALMRFLGLDTQGAHLEFPLTDEDERAADDLQLGFAPQRYVCLHPGSRDTTRRWAPRNFARLADLCAARGYAVVITGTADERPLAEAVAAATRAETANVAGRTSLGAVAALLRQARLLITNDTGVSHVCAGLGTPSLVVSTHSEVERWSPLDGQRHRTFDWDRNPNLEHVEHALAQMLGDRPAPRARAKPTRRRQPSSA